MAGTASRRVLGYLVAIAFAALPALAQPMTAGSASTGTLFAITGSENLVKVDPGTGAFTSVGSLNTPDNPQSNSLASDPATHRLYAVRTTVTFDINGPIFTFSLLTIDSRTGTILSSPQFNNLPAQSLVFDTSTGTLFGFTGLAIVRVDPATAATTPIATIANTFGPFIYSLAVDSASHTLYLSQEDISGSIDTNSTRIFSVSTSGGPVSTSAVLATPVRQIAVDSGNVFGVTDCCSFPTSTFNFVGVNLTTGALTALATIPGSIIQFGSAVDTATHTVYIDTESQDPVTFAWIDHIVSINDQAPGTPNVSGPLPDSVVTLGLAFEPAISITAASIETDVSNARASGAIDNAGIATALLSQLNAAAAARANGQCGTAAIIYTAFINAVNAQSGQHVSASTAAQLVTEAQFLIANCP